MGPVDLLPLLLDVPLQSFIDPDLSFNHFGLILQGLKLLIVNIKNQLSLSLPSFLSFPPRRLDPKLVPFFNFCNLLLRKVLLVFSLMIIYLLNFNRFGFLVHNFSALKIFLVSQLYLWLHVASQ
jgi:hypothetical protein